MRVLNVADLHCGSREGLSHPDFDRNRDISAPTRRALWKRWQALCGSSWAKPDALVVPGDLIEGQDRKSSGTGCWTTSLKEQWQCAAKLLLMLEAKKTYILYGSDYHEQIGDSGLYAEDLIAEAIGAEYAANQEHIRVENRTRGAWDYYLTFERVTVHYAHWVWSSYSPMYISTPLARALLTEKLNDEVEKYTKGKHKTRVVVRAHSHHWLHLEYSHTRGFLLPCWKARDIFQSKRGKCAIRNDIGALGFEIKGEKLSYEKILWPVEEVQRPNHIIVRV